MHSIKTYNQISNRGLSRFSAKDYIVAGDAIGGDAILLRSHKLTIDEVGDARAVARAGAGTNNVPVADCTERGVVVFNTPGANANAVKELVLCG
jgi:D-3-phosphoglycerate dehydrogenase